MKTNNSEPKQVPVGIQVKTGLQAGMTNPAASYCSRKGGRNTGDSCVISLANMRNACLPKPGPYFGQDE